MLNKPECKVEFDGDGKAIGVTSEGETAKCKKVVCDPSYLPDKVSPTRFLRVDNFIVDLISLQHCIDVQK